ncbi:MAG: hypothetical protein JRE23_13925 [Deltaproteobacteria bacterium]|nr:hypothetical protein [Deltaproteobacteria bacterium]
MKDDGPIFANLEVDGIWDEDVCSAENGYLVKDVIGKNFSVSCSPAKIEGDVFKEITADMIIENNTDYAMRLEGYFEQHKILRPFPYSIETEMPAHSKKVVQLQISSKSDVVVGELGSLIFKRTVYCKPDSRPEIPYRENLEIKIEKASTS